MSLPQRTTAESDSGEASRPAVLPAEPRNPQSERSLLGGNFRWVICGLLLFGTTKNYMDRQVLGILKDTLQQSFHWNEIDYSNLVLAFQAAYAVGMLAMGRLIDKLGTRIGYAIAMIFWSVASMAHAVCGSLLGFGIARAALGFGEAGVFPASMKTVAEWFPKKQRSLATGIFNAGCNVGAIMTPLLAPWITMHLGWRWTFVIIGALGFLWLFLWLVIYRKPQEHKLVTAQELRYIQSDIPDPVGKKVPWAGLLRYRQTWAYVLGKFLTDPIWWFYLFWAPGFFQNKHHLTLQQIGTPLVAIYVISDVGSIFGGWLSTWLIGRGWSVNAGRKGAMLFCSLLILPVVFVYRIESVWSAALLIGLAAAGHQGFSANLFTLTCDLFPSRAVGSVTGIGGMAGAIGGMLIAKMDS